MDIITTIPDREINNIAIGKERHAVSKQLVAGLARSMLLLMRAEDLDHSNPIVESTVDTDQMKAKYRLVFRAHPGDEEDGEPHSLVVTLTTAKG